MPTATAAVAQNFASMQLAEIRHNLTSRRNRIFLLMEEVRRLRIQQRLKVRRSSGGLSGNSLSPRSPALCYRNA